MTDFTTTAKIKSFFNLTTSDQDALIAEILPRITKEIQTYCKRELFSATYTEYLNGNGKSSIMLKEYPITAITKLYDDPERVFGSDTELTTDDYIFIAGSEDSLAGILRLYCEYFGIGYSNVKVVYVAGYSVIPADIEEAAILKMGAELMLNKFIFNAPIVDGNGFEIKDPGSMKKRATELLLPYRRLV